MSGIGKRLAAVAASVVLTVGLALCLFPTSAQAASCGKLTASRPTLNAKQHRVFASGGVSFSCKGWTKYCVHLVHEFLAGAPYPTPMHSYDAKRCSPLTTNVISKSSTNDVECHSGYYITDVWVYKGKDIIKRLTSDKYDYTGGCLLP